MKCREFAEIVHDLARSRVPDGAVAAVAREHAESCAACAGRLAEAQRLAKILQNASNASRSLSAPERLESKLLAAFRAENATRRSPQGWWKPWRRLALGGAVAGLVVAGCVFALLGHAPERSSAPVARSGSTSQVATKAPVQTTAAPKGVAQRASAATQSGTNTNLASGFVPVPFSGGFAPGDSAVIVRVQVPRSALAELGYPVDETQGEGIVQADLLVGEDGWPQAVRIVR